MALLEDLGGYLDTQSASITLGTNFFLGYLPETPSDCVALLGMDGASPLFTHGATNTPAIERPNVQLLVRHSSYATGQSLSETLYRILTAIANQSISGTTYLRVSAMDFPAFVERDQNRRSLFSTNFEVQRLG
jgi:hypothetical protein